MKLGKLIGRDILEEYMKMKARGTPCWKGNDFEVSCNIQCLVFDGEDVSVAIKDYFYLLGGKTKWG